MTTTMEAATALDLLTTRTGLCCTARSSYMHKGWRVELVGYNRLTRKRSVFAAEGPCLSGALSTLLQQEDVKRLCSLARIAV